MAADDVQRGEILTALRRGRDDASWDRHNPSRDSRRWSSSRRASGGRPRQALCLGDVEIDRDRHEARREGRPLLVTTAEFRLLVALAEAQGRVLSRDALLDALYGHGAAETLDRTIDVYVGRLREKLGDDPDRPRYIATVRGVGYRAVLVTEQIGRVR